MKLKPALHLMTSLGIAALVAGCSESTAPESKSEAVDQSAERVAAIVEADPISSGDGPQITGADAAHPDKKTVAEIDGELPPLPIEETGRVATLPSSYPETWVMVDEASFFNMFGGKVIVLDVAETKHPKRIKGLVPKNLLGNFTQSKTRGEFYVLETFHARGGRGPREDVLAIYDKKTLSITKEIVWPKPNRLQALPERYAMSLSGDEKLLYAANFDPAASFNVINLDTQEIVTEVPTPGCVMTFPAGKRGVASLCNNGSILNTKLNADGTLASQTRNEPFFDTDDTPIFEHAVYINGVAHFPSFKGLLHSFDMRSEEPKYMGSWDMLSEEDKKGKWRPSGLGLNDFDDSGLMYTIFQPDGHEGSQTHGGTQVWVFDLEKKERVRVIDTPKWAISIAVTRGDKPLLVVTNGELSLDVFNAQDGSLLQTVADFGNVTPLLVHKSY